MPQMINYSAKEPLIHIGFPKSASTWLQRNLFQPDQGYVQLMGPVDVQLNIIDPPVFFYEPGKVHQLIDERIRKKDVEGKWIHVVTSEALSGKPYGGGYDRKELADRLKATFPEGRILIVLREQKAIILSLYKLVVNWGLPHSLKQFLNPIGPRIAPQFNFEYLQYDRVVSYYQSIFGKTRVLVLPFEQFAKAPRTFITEIDSFFKNPGVPGVDLNRLPFDTKLNVSPPVTRLILRHWLNYYLVRNAFNYSGPIKNRRGIVFRLLKSSLGISDYLPEFINSKVKSRFKRYIETMTEGKFADSNRRLQDLIQVDLSQYGYDL